MGTPVIWVQDHGDFLEGSPEWQLAAPLLRREREPLARKAYRDSFVETSLADTLTRLDVQRLVVAGAQSDYCIRTTTHMYFRGLRCPGQRFGIADHRTVEL